MYQIPPIQSHADTVESDFGMLDLIDTHRQVLEIVFVMESAPRKRGHVINHITGRALLVNITNYLFIPAIRHMKPIFPLSVIASGRSNPIRSSPISGAIG